VEDELGRFTRRWTRVVLVALFAVVASLGLAIAVYLAHVRASATALVNSAREIRTKADAEREIAAWRERSGKDFWEESNHPGGDHNYDAVIGNFAVARLPFVQPTGVTVGITMRDGQLRCITVVESAGWHPLASVNIQEWFDEGLPNRFHVGQRGRPYAATVEFPSSLSDNQRTKAFAVDTNCLVRPRGCTSAEDILPGVWQFESAPNPE
jgi:hypothetical protein